MFLSREQIIKRLREGDLRISPLDVASQISDIGIDLRVGNEFVRTGTEAGQVVSIDFGKRIVLYPHSGLRATNVETIQLPPDLVGFLFLRSALSREGILSDASIISPGYRGQLVLSFYNLGPTQFALYPGER